MVSSVYRVLMANVINQMLGEWEQLARHLKVCEPQNEYIILEMMSWIEEDLQQLNYHFVKPALD